MNPFRILDSALALLDDGLERLRTRRTKDAAAAAFLLSPALLILGVFGLAPLVYAIYMSLFGGKYGMGPFVGLGNFRTALDSEAFWDSFLVTLYYALGTIPVTMALSFLIAYALFHIVRGRGFFRTVYFLPYVTSAVAAAMVWRAILNPQYGLANALIEWAGGPRLEWLLEPRGVLNLLTAGHVPPDIGPSLALCCIILFEVWHASGFMTVIFLAGLTAIPRELEEAARIDGANAFQVIRRVVIPLLSPTIFFLAIVSVIKSFQAFNSFYALTGNGRGPVDTTQNLTVYIYSSFYEYQRWGYGAAVATLLCIAIVLLTVIQWRFIGRKVHYE
ncbi:MAG: ABC transporter permease subunit [Nitrospiraceae bacterium]|nr:ABC transporter permease subunit [Nitrospiraceae bacterium]